MDKFILYNTADGKASIKLYVEGNTVWLTANQIASLFNITESTSRKHVNNIFEEAELDANNNTHYMRVDGVKQPVALAIDSAA